MGIGGLGMGLGGAQPPSASADANSSGSKTSGKTTKDQMLSQDLFATLSVFESRKNAENAASEENIRQTAAPFHKIGEKAKEIQKVLAELASDHLQLQGNTSNLKGEVMKEADHVEMAKRTKETPMALQGDNKAPEVFFVNLVRSFEGEMMYCRTKIEEVSQCMQAASNPCDTEEDRGGVPVHAGGQQPLRHRGRYVTGLAVLEVYCCTKIEEVSQCMQAASNPCDTEEDIGEVLQREHDTLKDLAAKVYAKHSQLVELSHALQTKAAPNEQEFFRPRAKENAKTPASSVVRPVLGGGGSGLLAFQEQQQRAKAVTLGTAPPTMPLATTTMPSMFSGGNNASCMMMGGTSFGGSGFGLGTGLGTTNTAFGTKPLFGNTTQPLQQSATNSPFAISSPFNTKPFGGRAAIEARNSRFSSGIRHNIRLLISTPSLSIGATSVSYRLEPRRRMGTAGGRGGFSEMLKSGGMVGVKVRSACEDALAAAAAVVIVCGHRRRRRRRV
ncbi:Nucleoporin p58/p45 [Chionoecetes opilio]|uniref:Nucleoporin p58/p45 n=1 Tax=Chionoecetes opilio TaxID=41210 RepID=A0A8J4Y7Y3_CHIOP|nr:Nucleoporin p58/p45 [Chionoecetes opilio]